MQATTDRRAASRATAHDGTDAIDRAVVFVDVVSSTELVEQHGDAQWLRRLNRHTRAVRAIAARHHGELTTFLGDGFMLLFEQPDDAMRFASRLQTAATVQNLFGIRAGIDYGPVLPYDDSWYVGLTIHIASRLCDLAQPGEVVLTERCYQAASERTLIPADRRFQSEIRGVSGLLPLVVIELDEGL